MQCCKKPYNKTKSRKQTSTLIPKKALNYPKIAYARKITQLIITHLSTQYASTSLRIYAFHAPTYLPTKSPPTGRRVLPTPRRIKYQLPTRHAHKIPIQEIHDPARWILKIHRPRWELPHAVEPLLEGYNVCEWDVECRGEEGDHFLPGLAGGVLNVVDWVEWCVRKE